MALLQQVAGTIGAVGAWLGLAWLGLDLMLALMRASQYSGMIIITPSIDLCLQPILSVSAEFGASVHVLSAPLMSSNLLDCVCC